MYVVTYETSSLESLSFLQHTLFHHVCYRSFVFCFSLKLKWTKNKIVYGIEVSLFGIPANRNSANSNN